MASGSFDISDNAAEISVQSLAPSDAEEEAHDL
jgi:hypothetical protein